MQIWQTLIVSALLLIAVPAQADPVNFNNEEIEVNVPTDNGPCNISKINIIPPDAEVHPECITG